MPTQANVRQCFSIWWKLAEKPGCRMRCSGFAQNAQKLARMLKKLCIMLDPSSVGCAKLILHKQDRSLVCHHFTPAAQKQVCAAGDWAKHSMLPIMLKKLCLFLWAVPNWFCSNKEGLLMFEHWAPACSAAVCTAVALHKMLNVGQNAEATVFSSWFNLFGLCQHDFAQTKWGLCDVSPFKGDFGIWWLGVGATSESDECEDLKTRTFWEQRDRLHNNTLHYILSIRF